MKDTETTSTPPLVTACEEGSLEEVRKLLAEGADPNAVDELGASPLHAARDRDVFSPELIRLLVEAGADPNEQAHDRGDTSVIADAFAAKDLELVAWLIAHGAHVTFSDLSILAEVGDPAMLEAALAAPWFDGIDESENPPAPPPWSERIDAERLDELWTTTLTTAASSGEIEWVDRILARRSDAETLRLAWEAAGQGGQWALLEHLESKAPASKTDREAAWRAALPIVAAANNLEAVQSILSRDPDAEAARLARLHAGEHGHRALLDWLDERWPPSQADRDGALFRAARLGNLGGVVRSLEGGASARARNAQGETPLHGAASPQVLECLVKAGADLEARDGEGRTPLLYAADHTSPRRGCVDWLIARGADLHAKDARDLGVVAHLEHRWSKAFPPAEQTEIAAVIDDLLRRGCKRELWPGIPPRELTLRDRVLAWVTIGGVIVVLVFAYALIKEFAGCGR